MFPSNGDKVLTPNGQIATVVDNRNRSNIHVQLPDREAGQRSEFYPAEELRPAPNPNDKDLTGKATKTIIDKIDEIAGAFSHPSTQTTVRKNKSGDVTLQNTDDVEKKD